MLLQGESHVLAEVARDNEALGPRLQLLHHGIAEPVNGHEGRRASCPAARGRCIAWEFECGGGGKGLGA